MKFTEEQMAKVRELVIRRAKPEASSVSWWDVGNYDDVYKIGTDAGESSLAYEIAHILGIELPPAQELVLDY
jgi:hypothetical protein